MSKILLAYIAGPFRGPRLADIDRNVQIAAMFRAPLAEAGVFPICVHLNEGCALHDVNQENNGQWWVDATLEVLRRCDLVVLVPGWEGSVGTEGEITEAEKLGLPIFQAGWDWDCSLHGIVRPAPIYEWQERNSVQLSLRGWLDQQKGK